MNLSMTKMAAPSGTVLRILPQLVTSATCLRCDICCRFPDADSPLRPYFTNEEIAQAVRAGLAERVFPDPTGCQIAVQPDLDGEGFLCPAFNRMDGSCRIYEHRPLDCRLYPLALMWDDAQREVWLGWDAKCPFLVDQAPETIRTYADQVVEILRDPEMVARIAQHPGLVGRFQADVTRIIPLPDLSRALVNRWGTQPLRRLMLEDLSKLAAALERSGLKGGKLLAAYSLPYHYIWAGLLAYWWAEVEGAFCLFVRSPDGWFMPLPPLTGGDIRGPLAACFQLMRHWNKSRAVGRVENLPASLAADAGSLGYRVAQKDPDYLYRAADLVALAGDRYKAQRALCNRAERLGSITVEPYRLGHRRACRDLFEEWQRQKRRGKIDSFASLLLEDAASAHEVAWSHDLDLGLVGSVLRVEKRIRAYTFGYWLDRKTYCVILEVADRSIPGLAQYLFRETCRRAFSEGAEFINTMDDSGLSGLRLAKQAYHPVDRIQNALCSEISAE